MSDPDHKARMADLEARIQRLKGPEEKKKAEASAETDHFSAAQMGWRMVTELVAGLLIGFGIGYGLDYLFGTIPIFIVLFTLLGFVAGVKTMLATAREMQGQTPETSGTAAQGSADETREEDDER